MIVGFSRRGRVALGVIGFTLGVSGCSSSGVVERVPTCWIRGDDPLPATRPIPGFTKIGDARILSNRMAEAPLDVIIPEGTGAVGFRLTPGPTSPPSVSCVQIAALSGSNGAIWVTPDPFVYCQSCPQRVSLGVGYGYYVLPSNADVPALDGSLSLDVASPYCPASGPFQPVPEHVTIEAQFLPSMDTSTKGILPIELVFLPPWELPDGEEQRAALDALVEGVNKAFASTNLTVKIKRLRQLATKQENPLDFELNEPTVLADLGELAQSCPGNHAAGVDEEPAIPIFLGGCLIARDSVLGDTYPEGFTTHIPGGFPPPGAADGVFLQGTGCGANPSTVWPSEKILAHELGHYLGLYHSIEADGREDQLDDTGPNNIMHFMPSLSTSEGFSSEQMRVMRRHPMVRYLE